MVWIDGKIWIDMLGHVQAVSRPQETERYVPDLNRLFTTSSVNGNRAADMMGTEQQTFSLTARENNENEMM